MRGDVMIAGVHPYADRGSPPRARGRLWGPATPPVGPGLTPACAGTSPAYPTTIPPRRAHPRVRGDVEVVQMSADLGSGSPPRARGRRQPRGLGADEPGLTPACAGTSIAGNAGRTLERAHPRVRGDVQLSDPWEDVSEGSPPRARGRLQGPPPGVPGAGLTPACAGTSRPPRSQTSTHWAHPRVRGDVLDRLAFDEVRQGSPPRARGRRCCWQGPPLVRGLTPACAGTSRVPATS